MLTIRKIKKGELKNIREQWNALLHNSASNTIFLTWEWITTWCSIFKKDDKLFILLIQDEKGNFIGIAPLRKRKRKVLGVQIQIVEFICSGKETTPDHLAFIILEGHETEVLSVIFDYFKKEEKEWDVLNLIDTKEDAETFEKIRKLLKKMGYQFNFRNSGICPYIKLPDSWEEYCKNLSKNTSYNIKRKRRKLSEHTEIEFITIEDKTELDEVMRKLSMFHKNRMLEKKLRGNSLKSQFWVFHEKIAEVFLNNGWLFLGILKANREIVSCQYGFKYDDKVFFYQSGINPIYSNYSVGLITTSYMIEKSIKDKFREYDFLRGAESYKFHWTKTYRRNVEIMIWNKNLKAKMFLVLYYCKLFLQDFKKRVKADIAKLPKFLLRIYK